MPTLTPRWVLQYWGTEVCRKAFHDDIWIASLENKLRNSKDNVVISDCRFPNEISSIRNAGGQIVWVKRGELPSWYDVAVEANRGSNVAINELKMLTVDELKVRFDLNAKELKSLIQYLFPQTDFN
jgi:hypothetical protein